MVREIKEEKNIMLNGKKLNAFPLRSSEGCSLSPLLFNTNWMHHTGHIPGNTIKQQKKIKGLQIGEKERKWSPFIL